MNSVRVGSKSLVDNAIFSSCFFFFFNFCFKDGSLFLRPLSYMDGKYEIFFCYFCFKFERNDSLVSCENNDTIVYILENSSK